MSDESQSERIWRYAMQTEDVTLNLPNASTDTPAEAKKDDNSIVSADFPSSFRPSVPILNLHGLAESQSQTLAALDVSGDLSERDTRDQGQTGARSAISYYTKPGRHATPLQETMESTIPSFEQPPAKNQVPARLPALEKGHVTGASPPRGGSPIVGRVTDVETKAVPMTDQVQRKEDGHSKHSLQRNKASSFHVQPQEPSLLPSLKRINTMPPRLSRYAPRDVEPSSQDSFAGSPPRQDLNTFIRNSRVFNNLVIRPGVAGQPSEIFELPESTESSDMPLPPQNRKATAATSTSKTKEQKLDGAKPDENKEEETPSQLIQAALEHGLIQRSPSPASASLPIVLVKDTQSDHQQSEDDGNESKIASGDDIEAQSDVYSESQTVEHSPAPSSSSFILPRVPAMDNDSPQPTQIASQDIPPGMIIISQHGVVLDSVEESGVSSVPVPEYRKLEFLQHYRRRSEVVPATPISTVPASGAGIPMAQRPVSTNDIVHASHRQTTKGKGKERAEDIDIVPMQEDRSKLISKAAVTPPLERSRLGQSSKLDKSPGITLPATEIVPDSQEGNNSGTSQESAAKTQLVQASTGEVVPDSQEEQQRLQLPQAQNPPSSPSIPLAQRYATRPTPSSSPSIPLIQMTNRMETSGFPTPTPAAVKSPLRKGLLPGGVTHTRGRGRPSAKGKEPAKAVSDKGSDNENQSSNGENNVMEVDEEKASEMETARQEPSTSKRTRRPTSKAKARSPEKRTTRQRQRRKSPIRKMASRKRKSETKVEQQPGELPPSKRHRSGAMTPGPSHGAIELTKRVLARRQDDNDYFHSGTVHLEFTFADPLPTSFIVEFDEGFEEPIDLDHIRFFQLEPEDLIEVIKSRKNERQYCRATVLDTDHWQEDEIAQVHDVEGGPDGDDYDVNGQDIRVSEEQIRLQWNERCINLRTLCKDKEYDLPRRNKHLAGYAFIVTLPDLPKSKRSLERVIELSGGAVCEWHSIVSLSGTSEVDGNRLVGKSTDVRLLKNKAKIKSLFCIADEPRTTPKFLIALALGVPCLSVDWVLAKVTDSDVKFDWQAYILPAGTNPVTRLAASQNFERLWWRDIHNFTKLISEPPVLKPFAGKLFLCVGPSFILKSKEFGTYPKVLLAMGASAVQAVTDLKYLNTKSQVNFDYTVVDDDAELVSYDGSLSVNILWIKKCLITGIEGPVPWSE